MSCRLTRVVLMDGWMAESLQVMATETRRRNGRRDGTPSPGARAWLGRRRQRPTLRERKAQAWRASDQCVAPDPHSSFNRRRCCGPAGSTLRDLGPFGTLPVLGTIYLWYQADGRCTGCMLGAHSSGSTQELWKLAFSDGSMIKSLKRPGRIGQQAGWSLKGLLNGLADPPADLTTTTYTTDDDNTDR